ncbi:MAG: NFACT RNA binding domain-containing protein, partial [Gemmatimonadota bacterium]
MEPGERRAAALRNVAWLSALNVEWVLGAAGGGGGGDDRAGDPLEAAHRRYRELLSAREEAVDDPASAGLRLLSRPWGPHPLGEDDAPRADGPLEAMEAAARRDGTWEALASGAAAGTREADREPPDPELVELASALEDRVEEMESRRESLRRELEEGPEPDELRATGSLLLARKGEIERGQERVRVEDFEGGEREIELDPRLPVSDNADRYFERARRRERAAERIPEEIADVEERAERVRAALSDLEEALEDPDAGISEEQVEAWWALAGGRPDGDGDDGEGERKPYRVLRTSGGLEVRVGKSAKANEELTFHHSHTEDIWLHARQVAGSHVILRWGRKDQNPPREDLLEAAIAAAANSKARHSGSVAV